MFKQFLNILKTEYWIDSFILNILANGICHTYFIPPKWGFAKELSAINWEMQ